MMTLSALENLVKVGQLKLEAKNNAEIQGLLRSGKARLIDAQHQGLSVDSQFDLAYNAAHALALLALRWHGYRAENRYMVFQCLVHTLHLPNIDWRILDHCHRKRNIAEYEGHLDVQQALVDDLIRVTCDVLARIEQLLVA